MKKILTLTVICIFSLTSCSGLSEMILNTGKNLHSNEEKSTEVASNNQRTTTSNSKKQSKSTKNLKFMYPAVLMGPMFSTLYYAYFTWGGVYTKNSLRPGHWAKYKYVVKESNGATSDDLFITKAFLKRTKKSDFFRLKIENNKEWILFDFEIDKKNYLQSILYKNSNGESTTINSSTPILTFKNTNLNFRKLPSKTIRIKKRNIRSYKFSMNFSSDEEINKINIFLSPRIPGYLVKYVVENSENEKLIMELIKYGRRAKKDLRS